MSEPAGITWPGSSPPACLVSGASGGLGCAVAERLAGAGATVVITSREPGRTEAAAAELAGAGDVRALPAGLDVADAGSVHAAARAVAALTGRLDVLVNNAAAYADWGETAAGADLAASRAVMDINLYGTWRVIQAFLPLLRRSEHPRIVNVASGAGSHGDEQYGLAARHGAAASYGISKAAVLALTATLAAELDGTPVIVNAVDPGLTATWPGAEACHPGSRSDESLRPSKAILATAVRASLPEDVGRVRADDADRPARYRPRAGGNAVDICSRSTGQTGAPCSGRRTWPRGVRVSIWPPRIRSPR